MKGCHLCNDPELFWKVKEAIPMRQVAEHYGLEVNRKGLCQCPFHNDSNPSLKIYPNGKGFYCFVCGAGGDQVKFVSMYQNLTNTEAAKELALAFHVPVHESMTYKERREAEIAGKKRRQVAVFAKRAKMFLTVYRGLLCEAIHERDGHFTEALQRITYTEYLLECLASCPEEVFGDRKAVELIGKIEGRINNWHIRIEPDGSISR